jgi:hypothetical protein
MKNLNAPGRRQARTAGLFPLLALVLTLLLAGGPAHAEEPSLSEDSQACQDCHDKPGLAMRTQDDQPLSLHVSTAAYLASRHNTTDCVDCHEDIEDDAHAEEKPPVKSRRDHARPLNDGCKSCHKKQVAQFADSVHAALLDDGSDKAPMCSDCHAVHTLQSVKSATPVAETACLQCHEEIGRSYVEDVHGRLRVAKGEPAPLCADCHRAHAIQAASFGDGLRDTCLGCHEDTVAQHRDWLPNAGRHFEAISCPVCHAPTAERRVNLRLYDRHGPRRMTETGGVPRFVRHAASDDGPGTSLDERALWSLLQQFNAEDAEDVVLRGRLEVRHGVQAHQMADKSQAIRDCDTCHREGAEPFQSVVLTVAGADGRPLRQAVDSNVLNSLKSIESVRGFYAIGANRIKLLDVLLVLVVLGSVGGVLAHATMRRATRRLREQLARERRTSGH